MKRMGLNFAILAVVASGAALATVTRAEAESGETPCSTLVDWKTDGAWRHAFAPAPNGATDVTYIANQAWLHTDVVSGQTTGHQGPGDPPTYPHAQCDTIID